MLTEFFFFKQKTAYEIPKRDWSSDVCSSDFWLVHYKGKLVAPFTGRFRFIGRGDNLIAVRFNGKNVLVNALGGKQFDRSFPGMQFWPGDKHRNTTMSDWITITVGETCDMEVALSEWEIRGSAFC